MRDIQTVLNLAIANGYNVDGFMCYRLDRLRDRGILSLEESEASRAQIDKFIDLNSNGSFGTLNSAITYQSWFIKNPKLSEARDLKELGPLKIAIYSHWDKRQEIIETGPSHPLVQNYIK